MFISIMTSIYLYNVDNLPRLLYNKSICRSCKISNMSICEHTIYITGARRKESSAKKVTKTERNTNGERSDVKRTCQSAKKRFPPRLRGEDNLLVQ